MIIKNMPAFKSREEKLDWLAENSEELILAAKTQIKYADAFGGCEVETIADTGTPVMHKSENGAAIKTGVVDGTQDLNVKAIINTTNLFDSHKDVHIPGLWNKSLKTYTRMKHLQEHSMRFKDVIADKENLLANVVEYKWRELGFDYEGKTQALEFTSTVKHSRNPYMHEQYNKGHVDNHSVGMQYVKMLFAMNSDKDHHAQYKINWDKYIDQVANRKDAEKSGYMWIVLEAKAIEGSAVVNGSNFATPTQSVSSTKHSDSEEEKTTEGATEQSLSDMKSFINNLN